ncbi:MAG TPA: formyltransferase family protein [Planctomycetota bacterium]|nr:formyltransferase family protein [Planctomycetota bacterium]
MRTVVFGYHSVGTIGIQALIDAGFQIVAVVTHHDNPKETIWFDSVAEKAHSLGVPVLMPDDPNTELLAVALQSLRPEVVFSFYYRTVLKKRILNLFKRGAYNLHGSLLPAYRGCAPINWQILRGERMSGVTLHRMIPKIDGGEIIEQLPMDIGPDDTALMAFEQMIPVMKQVLDRALPKILDGTVTGKSQDDTKSSYFGRRKPDDGRLLFDSMTALEMYNLMRAVAYPYPGTFCYRDAARLKVQWLKPAAAGATLRGPGTRPGQVLAVSPLTVACREGAVELVEVGEPKPLGPRHGPVHEVGPGARRDVSPAKGEFGGAEWAFANGVQVGTIFR